MTLKKKLHGILRFCTYCFLNLVVGRKCNKILRPTTKLRKQYTSIIIHVRLRRSQIYSVSLLNLCLPHAFKNRIVGAPYKNLQFKNSTVILFAFSELFAFSDVNKRDLHKKWWVCDGPAIINQIQIDVFRRMSYSLTYLIVSQKIVARPGSRGVGCATCTRWGRPPPVRVLWSAL
jgi:hypothetical protein